MSNRDSIRKIFETTLEQARKVEGFNPTEQELSIMFEGFLGCFKARGAVALRRSPISWAGWTRRDGTVCEESRQKSVQSAFCRLLHYHMGTDGGYLGTLMNAMANLGYMAEAYGLLPHNASETDYWKLTAGTTEYEEAKRKRDENHEVEKTFADRCDTFLRVFIYIHSKGKTSSVAADLWGKALRSA